MPLPGPRPASTCLGQDHEPALKRATPGWPPSGGIAGCTSHPYWNEQDQNIDVDDDSWSAFKRGVVRSGQTVGVAIGGLVRAAVADGHLPEDLTNGAGQRRGQSGAGRRARRFARAAIDDNTWREFRRLVCVEGTTVAGAVGALIAQASRDGH